MRKLLLPFLLLVACAFRLEAHPMIQDAMWVVFEPERLHVAVNVSLRELCVVQGIPNDAKQFGAADLQTIAEQHAAYVLSHLRFSVQGRELAGQVLDIKVPPQAAAPEETFFQFEAEYPFTGGLPGSVTCRQDTLNEYSYAPGQPWDVSYVVRLKRSEQPEVWAAMIPAGKTVELPTASAVENAPPAARAVVADGRGRVAGEYFRHGVAHILTGYDHLLFVGALVLATMSFWEMVKVIAAFTLAHTVTLTLAVLNIVRLPAAFVEPMIAASIVFVALDNVFRPGNARSRVRLLVAFGFGLVHGLGFAGGLVSAMDGLPAVGLGLGIAAFSLGVECGHQIVVLPLFGALRLGRTQWRAGFQPLALRYGSAIISLAGAYYLVNALRTV